MSVYLAAYVCKVFCPEADPSLDMHYEGSTVVANKTGPTRVADFRAVFTPERPHLFLGPETTYAVEQ